MIDLQCCSLLERRSIWTSSRGASLRAEPGTRGASSGGILAVFRAAQRRGCPEQALSWRRSRLLKPFGALALLWLLSACTGNVRDRTAEQDGAPRPDSAKSLAGDQLVEPLPSPEAGPADLAAEQAPPADLGDPCRGVSCSNYGECVVDSGGQPSCACELYYVADGLSCVSACTGVNCPEGKTCVPGHHGQTDPLCVEVCDCSNCGNCGPGEIPSYGVAYCGNPDGAPASVTCTDPCPAGYGCIPFDTPICWPMQGCLSQ